MTTVIDGTTGVSKVQDGVVVQADLDTAILPLGVEQTWQVVTGSRALSTDYINGTGRPIQLHIVCRAPTNSNASLLVDGAEIGRFITNANVAYIDGACFSVIPAGATYRVNIAGSTTLISWAELR